MRGKQKSPQEEVSRAQVSAPASPVYLSSAQALTGRALLKLPAWKPCPGSSTGKIPRLSLSCPSLPQGYGD